MDPISTAVLSAIAAGATQVAGTALNDAYKGLKGILRRRYGTSSRLYQTLRDVERNPDNDLSRAALVRLIQASPATRDRRILAATDEVIRVIQQSPDGDEIIASIQQGGVAVHGDMVESIVAGGNLTFDHSRQHFTTIGPDQWAPDANTSIGRVIIFLGMACALVGFLFFFLALTDSSPDEDSMNLAFRIAAIGIIVALAGRVVDGLFNRRD
jgi:hypothetical protein